METELNAHEKIIDWLMQCVRGNYVKTDDADTLTDDSDLYEDGYIESRDFQDFINRMEQQFQLTISEDYFFDERFSTIAGISEIIVEIRNNGR
ncbi:MAG: hypothetical protein JSV88_31920 [Candidatus Aminicenantes bacterium]|nr:MAG: hypothetical protein JSV88_31920 [Candidatus Aminicenantes bacterium]